MCIYSSSEEGSAIPAAAVPIVVEAVRGCEALTSWVQRFKAKTALLKSSRDRDLRREVLVSHASLKAQAQLDLQQRLRRQKWAEMKARQMAKCDTCFAPISFCSCNSLKNVIMEECEESKKIDAFLNSMNSMNSMSLQQSRKRPSILRSNHNSKRIKT
jgi:hypothetical protein